MHVIKKMSDTLLQSTLKDPQLNREPSPFSSQNPNHHGPKQFNLIPVVLNMTSSITMGKFAKVGTMGLFSHPVVQCYRFDKQNDILIHKPFNLAFLDEHFSPAAL